MKKITLLAFACAMFMGNFSAKAQEVTYVEDAAQGYLFNKMQDNWWIEVDGGAGVLMSTWDAKQDFGKRLGLKGQLAVGKWFSPLLGIRVGGEFNQMMGVTNKYGLGYRPWNKSLGKYEGTDLRPSKFNNIGAFGDVMFNATNWICGYKPGRFYNAVVYAGLGMHWVFEHERTGAESRGDDWKYAGGEDDGHSRNLSARFGLLNQFSINKNWAINLDLRFEMLQEHTDGAGHKTWNEYPSALIGVAYKFNKTEWNAPVVPVCPEIKYTDAYVEDLRNKLVAANQNITNLKKQLEECHKQKVAPVEEKEEAALATIYFPINVSKLVGVQTKVVDAVAEVLKEEGQSYILTGYADNYTGTDAINTKLRLARAKTVKNRLVAKGVDSDRLKTHTSKGNHPYATSAKRASLGRCVTIERAK